MHTHYMQTMYTEAVQLLRLSSSFLRGLVPGLSTESVLSWSCPHFLLLELGLNSVLPRDPFQSHLFCGSMICLSVL